MCMSRPKLNQAEPAAPPPDPEKTVETLDIGSELARRQRAARGGLNRLRIAANPR